MTVETAQAEKPQLSVLAKLSDKPIARNSNVCHLDLG